MPLRVELAGELVGVGPGHGEPCDKLYQVWWPAESNAATRCEEQTTSRDPRRPPLLSRASTPPDCSAPGNNQTPPTQRALARPRLTPGVETTAHCDRERAGARARADYVARPQASAPVVARVHPARLLGAREQPDAPNAEGAWSLPAWTGDPAGYVGLWLAWLTVNAELARRVYELALEKLYGTPKPGPAY